MNPPTAGPPLEPAREFPAAPDPRFQMRKWLRHLRHLWWVPALTLTLSLTAALAYVLHCAPTYVSQASLWETERIHLPETVWLAEDPQSRLANQAELLQCGQLQALTRASFEPEPEPATHSPRQNPGPPPPVKISARQAPKSSVVLVAACGPDPAYVQAYLERLLQQYLQFKKELRQLVYGDIQATLSAQALRLNLDLKDAQSTLAAFEQSHNLALLQAESAAAGTCLVKLQTQLADYQLEAQLLDAPATEVRLPDDETAPFTGGRLNLPPAPPAGPLAVALELPAAYHQIGLLRLQRARLSQYLRPKHPKMVRLEDAIAAAQQLLELDAAQDRAQRAAARQSLSLKCGHVQASLRAWQATAVEANARLAEAEGLKLNVHLAQDLSDRLGSLLQNLDLSRSIDPDTLAILQPASPAKRTYVREWLVLALAWLGGSGTGLGLVFLLTCHDDRFTSVGEVDASLGDAVVGWLPNLKSARAGALSLLEFNDSRFQYAEAYRSLRSALLHLPGPGERPKLILVTSAMPKEGKSTIAANLARTLAWGGARVLLVDANLKQSHLHELLGRPCEPGLIELLRQPDSWNRVVPPASLPACAFLSRGNGTGHTSDLFLGPAFDDLLGRMRRLFDYVLIDSSPVLIADDASTLAPKLDGTLFVVRGNYSSGRLVREGLEQLRQRQARILGLVFNRADVSNRADRNGGFVGCEEPGNGLPCWVPGHTQ